MPYINIRLLDNGVSKEQKQILVKEITDLMVRVLDKKPELTHVVIDEVPLDNWGCAGKLASDR